jgi:hypothetical protein
MTARPVEVETRWHGEDGRSIVGALAVRRYLEGRATAVGDSSESLPYTSRPSMWIEPLTPRESVFTLVLRALRPALTRPL